MNVKVVVIPIDYEPTPGKLADAEVHFEGGLFDGIKLVGFSIWETRNNGVPGVHVVFPARQYSINGERKSFALLRPINDNDLNRRGDLAMEIIREYNRMKVQEGEQK